MVAGDRVRVVAIDGLVLEVEPEEGGAIDYREMRDRRKGSTDQDADGTADQQSDDAADEASDDEGDGRSLQ